MSDVRLSRETVEALHRYISIHLERTPEKWRLLAALDADLARCPEPQPGDDGDQKNPPQKNMRSRP